MKNRIAVVSAIVLSVASFQGARALAQAVPSSRFGVRYVDHFTDKWGVQPSSGFAASRAHATSASGDLGLTPADLDLERHVIPGYEFADHNPAYYLRDNLFVDFDTRYRYLGRLAGGDGPGINTAEMTFNLDYRF
jgi:hypothetical protein